MSQTNFGHYMECSLALGVDLVNTLDPVDGTERLPDAAALAAFVATHLPSDKRRPTARDLAEVTEVRARLRRVFEARDDETAARVLNELLSESGARPELTGHDGEPWHLHYSPPGSRLAPRIAAEAAMALAVVVAQGGFARLRTCEGEGCVDVFVDASRNRSRRFCSPAVCGNRASVAAFRARRRSGTRRG